MGTLTISRSRSSWDVWFLARTSCSPSGIRPSPVYLDRTASIDFQLSPEFLVIKYLARSKVLAPSSWRIQVNRWNLKPDKTGGHTYNSEVNRRRKSSKERFKLSWWQTILSAKDLSGVHFERAKVFKWFNHSDSGGLGDFGLEFSLYGLERFQILKEIKGNAITTACSQSPKLRALADANVILTYTVNKFNS